MSEASKALYYAYRVIVSGFSSSIHITDFFRQTRPFSGFCRLTYSFLTTQMGTPTARPQTQNPAFITDIQEKCQEIDAPKKKNGHGRSQNWILYVKEKSEKRKRMKLASTKIYSALLIAP
jgi:hypothetical protein